MIAEKIPELRTLSAEEKLILGETSGMSLLLILTPFRHGRIISSCFGSGWSIIGSILMTLLLGSRLKRAFSHRDGFARRVPLRSRRRFPGNFQPI